MSGEKPLVEICKGVIGLGKVVLRKVRGGSAEVYLYRGRFFNQHLEKMTMARSRFFLALRLVKRW